MWPTPEANERNVYPRMLKTRKDGQSVEPNLAGAVAMWPTIRASDAERGGRGDLIQAARGNQNKHFATPRANYGTGAGRGPNLKGGSNLQTQVAALRVPTPRANDHKGSSKPGQRRGQLTDPAMGVIEAGGQLNPDWTEWLMGWPIGWTDLNATPDVETWKAKTLAGTWFDQEPDGVPRVCKSQPKRVARLKALGNGWVPLAGAVAAQLLMGADE